MNFASFRKRGDTKVTILIAFTEIASINLPSPTFSQAG